CTRQHDFKFGELTGLRIDVDRPAMLLDDDIVTNRQAQARAFSGWFSREKGIEHLLLYLGRNARSVIANRDLNFVAKVLCRGSEGWLIAFAGGLLLTLSRGIKAVGNKVQKCSRDLLRVHIDLIGSRIKGPLHIDLEALIFGAGTMIGEIEALLDEGVGI